jgi:hypothetical protein
VGLTQKKTPTVVSAIEENEMGKVLLDSLSPWRSRNYCTLWK